jgi:hypothetical protein
VGGVSSAERAILSHRIRVGGIQHIALNDSRFVMPKLSPNRTNAHHKSPPVSSSSVLPPDEILKSTEKGFAADLKVQQLIEMFPAPAGRLLIALYSYLILLFQFLSVVVFSDRQIPGRWITFFHQKFLIVPFCAFIQGFNKIHS